MSVDKVVKADAVVLAIEFAKRWNKHETN